jgi:hypothetical protein
MSNDLANILASLRPGASWALEGVTPADDLADQYAALDWRSEGDPPTLAECQDEATELTKDELIAVTNAERDRRIAAGFSFSSKEFDTDRESVKRILGAASAAHIAVTQNNSQAGDLRWADANADFQWIAADNTLLAMDAPTAIAFGQAYMAHERALIFAAKTIKDEISAGTYDGDPVNDNRWPS